MSKHLHDQLLISRLAQSETAAFARLRRLCFRPAVSHVMHNSGNRQDGEDVYADAEIVMYQKAVEGLVLSASVSTYMHCVCRQIWLMELRRRKRRKQTLSAIIPDFQSGAWDIDPEAEQRRKEQLVMRIHQAITELNPTKKVLILLSAYTSISGEEMAHETGLKDRMVVKVKLSQARKEVKDKILQHMLTLN
ncbi:sigma-70 family RNA polymerase sigma factor [Rhodocytophaga rosea]|uniref:Sigma-70 family RNA polymerase sigma factor n=1 Tax=Rhodocytophaga rosea TaxID=2704465 RepID=A0A6C0GLL4_9BACT|nr:sigma-70 family RNA polymerase sigma factor [Rhodocytophaga rosea]QHT68915.1 sigma-70 family RNA polymerase sigma factor [Rhodocytophaga rosea]